MFLTLAEEEPCPIWGNNPFKVSESEGGGHFSCSFGGGTHFGIFGGSGANGVDGGTNFFGGLVGHTASGGGTIIFTGAYQRTIYRRVKGSNSNKIDKIARRFCKNNCLYIMK